MSELFDMSECLSPRLKWMRAHSIRTYYNPDMKPNWLATTTWHGADVTERGESELDVLTSIATRLNLKLWNQ